MLYRASFRFLFIIAVIGIGRLTACGGVHKHTNEGPLPPSPHTYVERDETADRAESRSTRSGMDDPYERARDRYRDDAYGGRRISSDELMRALEEAERERAARVRYRPGEPMVNPTPSVQ